MGKLSAYHPILAELQRTFPYIIPRSLLARLAYCKQPPFGRFLTISRDTKNFSATIAPIIILQVTEQTN